MTPRALAATLALSSLLLPASPAAALDCGMRLVVVGDAEAQVRAVCGAPESMTTRTESSTDFVYGSVEPGRYGYGRAVTVTVQIDVWIYDFGRSRFMEELTFANGALRSMRPLGYGTPAGARRRRDSLSRHGALSTPPQLPGFRWVLPERRERVLTRA